MTVQKLSYDCDLTETGFSLAVGMLGVMPNQVTIYCVRGASTDAWLLSDKYGAKVVLLPHEIMADPDHWAIGYDNDFVWSPGA